MRYNLVEELSKEFPVSTLCQVIRVSRSAYYAYVNCSTYLANREKQFLLKEVKTIFDKHKRRYGSRRIREELKDNGIEIGLYRVKGLMKEQGLLAIQAKSFVPTTTQSHPHLRRCPNLLLEHHNLPSAPNQVVVGDITYLPTVNDWLYLAVWMDLFSRKIVGWCVDEHMEESLVIRPMKQLIWTRQPQKGFLVHSDGGGQYSSKEFKLLLELHQFRQSMTRKDNHYDNAFAESLFSRFKAELLDGAVFKDLPDAHLKSFEYIDGYYNTVRKHSSIGYLSPDQFEERFWKESMKK